MKKPLRYSRVFVITEFLKRKRKLVALLLLSYRCIVTINVLWLFVTVLWVGLQCVIVVFPDHTVNLVLVRTVKNNYFSLCTNY